MGSIARTTAGHRPPELCVELWTLIFDFATYVSDIYEPEFYDYSERIGPLNVDPHCKPAFKQSLETRRFIPLVCRAWYKLSIRFLYRSLWIEGFTTLPSLVTTLSSSGLERRDGDPTLGLYTERIDVVFPASRATDATELKGIEGLSNLTKCLPNLSAVVFAACRPTITHFDLPHEVIDAMYNLGARLKIIDWRNCQMRVSVSQVQGLFSSAPNLRHFSCYTCVSADSAALQPLPMMSSLSTFSYRHFQGQLNLDPTSMPALRHLVVESSRAPLPVWHGFLEAYGHQVRSVYFSISNEEKFQEEIDRIGASCPNLERLTLCVNTGHHFPRHLHLPPVHVLGLRFDVNTAVDAVWDYLWVVLSDVCEQTPSIRTVQFVAFPFGQLGQQVARGKERFPHLPIENHWDLAARD